jgi:hypothetical protein
MFARAVGFAFVTLALFFVDIVFCPVATCVYGWRRSSVYGARPAAVVLSSTGDGVRTVGLAFVLCSPYGRRANDDEPGSRMTGTESAGRTEREIHPGHTPAITLERFLESHRWSVDPGSGRSRPEAPRRRFRTSGFSPRRCIPIPLPLPFPFRPPRNRSRPRARGPHHALVPILRTAR